MGKEAFSALWNMELLPQQIKSIVHEAMQALQPL